MFLMIQKHCTAITCFIAITHLRAFVANRLKQDLRAVSPAIFLRKRSATWKVFVFSTPAQPIRILISLTVCRLLFVKFGISFSLFQFHFMLAPHNFSGSVALNYESYTRNWTVNFTRDKMYFFTTTSLQAVVYPLPTPPSPHVEEMIIVFLLNCAIKVDRDA